MYLGGNTVIFWAYSVRFRANCGKYICICCKYSIILDIKVLLRANTVNCWANSCVRGKYGHIINVGFSANTLTITTGVSISKLTFIHNFLQCFWTQNMIIKRQYINTYHALPIKVSHLWPGRLHNNKPGTLYVTYNYFSTFLVLII